MIRLANPLGPPGLQSTFYGLTWTERWYVCDAFFGPSVGGLPPALYAVVILGDADFTVRVSREEQPVWEGSVWHFFPGAEGSLQFVDGSVWPPPGRAAVKPHYNVGHPGHPFAGAAHLPPFVARLRTSEDKLGAQFTAEAADCPISLFLESHPRA